MRFKEFVSEAGPGSQTQIGGALAKGSGQLAGITLDVINRYFDWHAERNSKKKREKEIALRKQKSKLSPSEKNKANAVLTSPEIKKKADDWEKKNVGHTKRPTADTSQQIIKPKLMKSKQAAGPDGQIYTWLGGMWADARGNTRVPKEIQKDLFSKFTR